jgi:hypothetical protein
MNHQTPASLRHPGNSSSAPFLRFAIVTAAAAFAVSALITAVIWAINGGSYYGAALFLLVLAPVLPCTLIAVAVLRRGGRGHRRTLWQDISESAMTYGALALVPVVWMSFEDPQWSHEGIFVLGMALLSGIVTAMICRAFER